MSEHVITLKPPAWLGPVSLIHLLDGSTVMPDPETGNVTVRYTDNTPSSANIDKLARDGWTFVSSP